MDLAFHPKGMTGELDVEVRIAISYVSIENARANLEAEAAGPNFEQLAKKATDAWEVKLGRIRVGNGTAERRRVFYTC